MWSRSRLLVALLGLGAFRAAFAQPINQQPVRDPKLAEAIFKARLDSARMRFTPADAQFMQGMIHHHAQAVVMSRWAPSHGASPAVRTLAARIINAQQDEIAIMQTWLRDRKQPVPEVMEMNGQLMVHGAGHEGHDMQMPGMLTDAQMRELDAARGVEFDRLFLTYMIQHHKGATAMVSTLFSSDGAANDEAVFKFAADVNIDQTTEIVRMQGMLDALPKSAKTGTK
ncbi:MAG: DUF305 domain-containing protein [Gemmatimonadaceae bacterium]|jgi:uncharacterized protein (DUF305 family)|nr:DUF305 domain-containing protein [Gemmatimonadaceae bacterium]